MHRLSAHQWETNVLIGFMADAQIGHSLSRLYSVMGEKQVESVYCDFIKLPTDSGTSPLDGFFSFFLSAIFVPKIIHLTIIHTRMELYTAA